MYRIYHHTISNFNKVILILTFLCSSHLSFSNELDLKISSEVETSEEMDSLFIAVQELMMADSSNAQLLKESLMLRLLMTDYDDFYTLTKNLFLLDYKLERSGDRYREQY